MFMDIKFPSLKHSDSPGFVKWININFTSQLLVSTASTNFDLNLLNVSKKKQTDSITSHYIPFVYGVTTLEQYFLQNSGIL
jgi:hypothetical protein